MSAPNQPEAPNQEKIHIGDVVTQRRPEEVAVNITKKEFLTLCDGDTGDSKAKRDKFASLFWTAAVALGGFAASTQWDVVEQRHQKIPYAFLVLFIVLTAIFAAAWLIFRGSTDEKGKTSHYSRTRVKLDANFKACETTTKR